MKVQRIAQKLTAKFINHNKRKRKLLYANLSTTVK